MGSIEEPVDIEELAKKSAEKMLDAAGRKKADLDHPIIKWNKMFVTHSKTKYQNPNRPPKPTAHVLFTANFTNDTPKPQTYRLSTTRSTRSTCNIVLNKTYTVGASLEVKLVPPNPVIEANAGFHGEMSMEKGVCDTFEQELTWTVDNEIEVPSGHVTTAELVIKEDEFDGEFTTKTTFQGKVIVTYETKQHEHVDTVQRDVTAFLTPEKGFTKDKEGRPVFVTKGKCRCRFGIEQNVRLRQSRLPLPGATPEDEDESQPAQS